MRIIEIKIDADGEVALDLQGFKGKACDKTIADFLGGEKPTKITHKPEYLQGQAQQKETQRG